MTYFLKSGNKFKVTTKASLDLHERLPASTFAVGQDATGQFFLEQIDSFHLPKKLYGSTSRHCDRILTTFLDRTASSTGVLLSGEKGSGKTLLAKVVAVEAAERHQVPTIVVNGAWCGESFNTFLQLIDQPAIILLDEFEKVYSSKQQEMMLTLLDGVYPSQKLFLLTCNNKWRIDSNMRNRPGRVFYSLDFTGLEEAAIRGYCQDNLKAKDYIPAVCAISHFFSDFNFDMLKAIVEEMNRYNESPGEVLNFLNCRPCYGASSNYQVESLVVGGEDYVLESEKFTVFKGWNGNPMKEKICIKYRNTQENSRFSEKFNVEDLLSLDAKTGALTFVNRDGNKVVLALQKKFHLDYAALPTVKATVTSMDIEGSEEDGADINLPTGIWKL